ncbi:DUF2127 domain-containing protein [Saccharopolyspora rosea]
MTEKLFRVAVVLKGLDGVVQLLGGILVIFVPPSAITALAHVTTRDVFGGAGGPLAQHFEQAAEHFANGGTRTFVIAYLLVHGVIKIGLVIALLCKIRPAYPIAVVALGAFVVFEVLRATRTHSIELPFFAALDVLIIVMVIKEYFELRKQQARGPAAHDEAETDA